MKWAYFYYMEQLSVITICFNNLSDLQNTCSSVDAQSVKPYEHYIIDGSSNKDIAEWLQNTAQPSYRKWLCERDKGISDAFNKGLSLATGSLIHILNSADIYYSTTVIENVLVYFNKYSGIQWATGNIFMKRGGIWVRIGVPFDAGQLYKGMRSVSHPTWFLKKELYKKLGNFSLDLKIAMDYDLMCRLKNEPYGYMNETIVKFDDGGVSTNQYLKSLKENVKVYESYYGFSLAARAWQCRLSLLYYLLQSKFGKFLYAIKASNLK
ncbi:MAG: glycosyltransferase [Sediminibacterium sp.]|jgi:glycosyltransferase involved in cell wall biosynthesis|nr:MAG: glycosyltransferase [Sediminibacterium sp.]